VAADEFHAARVRESSYINSGNVALGKWLVATG
jgi:hypothetical protein